MIQNYFSALRARLDEMKFILKSEMIRFDQVSPEMGIIKGRLIFINGSILEFRELISGGEHDYRFHWMDKQSKVIRRWDTAPHHKNLANFPYHLHLPDQVKSSSEVDLIEILEAIKKLVIKELGKQFQ